MEIRIEDPNNNFNLTIEKNKINGVLGTNKEELAYKMNLGTTKNEKIWIDDKEIKLEEIHDYKEKIKIIPKEFSPLEFRYKVYELMYEEMKRIETALIDPKKKMIDSLTIVGLELDCLNQNIQDLSSSERKLLQIGMSLMSNPEVLIMIEPFKDFDLKTEKSILSLFQVMKEQYDKTIVIISDDVNMIYNYADHLIIEKNNKIIIEGVAKEILERVDFLQKNKIAIPEIVDFTYKARNKKVKIDFHKDIRDLIKDIYKHI